MAQWDNRWNEYTMHVENALASATKNLRKNLVDNLTADEVSHRFLDALGDIVPDDNWISKGGSEPKILRLERDWQDLQGHDAAEYYRDILKTADSRKCANDLCSQSR